MTEVLSPYRWANNLTKVLNAVYGAGEERFPINIQQLAKDYSRQLYPDDPITEVAGDALPGFDGALYRAPDGKKGWYIIYNSAVSSKGRINFTLAHELGHYLIHRSQFPEGLECGPQDMLRWDSEYRQIEQQANDFATTLLMPLDDYRRQIDAKAKPTLEDIGACAARYNVSLMAATLRWLQYTERRSVLVVSRDGFILWARSSTRAFKTGLYFKVSGRPPISIPAASLPAQSNVLEDNKGSVKHDAGVWLSEPCEEVSLISDQYDFAMSLLHFSDIISYSSIEEEPEEDVFDRMGRRPYRSFGEG